MLFQDGLLEIPLHHKCLGLCSAIHLSVWFFGESRFVTRWPLLPSLWGWTWRRASEWLPTGPQYPLSRWLMVTIKHPLTSMGYQQKPLRGSYQMRTFTPKSQTSRHRLASRSNPRLLRLARSIGLGPLGDLHTWSEPQRKRCKDRFAKDPSLQARVECLQSVCLTERPGLDMVDEGFLGIPDLFQTEHRQYKN